MWFDAIRKATQVISWDQLEEKEWYPPKSIWLDGEALEEWFERVDVLRKEKWKGDSDQTIEDPVDNAAAKTMVVG